VTVPDPEKVYLERFKDRFTVDDAAEAVMCQIVHEVVVNNRPLRDVLRRVRRLIFIR
jgi:hypothetical protein